MGIEKINPYIAAADAITNPLFAHLTNVKNRKFTREMYKTQRQDALSDWAMQNEYNSPRAQMQRFQEAGLNPHLIYGQTNEGATVRSSSAGGGSAQAPQTDFKGSLMSIYDMKTKSAQQDLLAGQLSLQEYQKKLMDAQAYNQIASAGRSDAETQAIMQRMGFESELQPIKVRGAITDIAKTEQDIRKGEQEIDKLKADIRYTIDQNRRTQELHQGNLTLQERQIKKAILDYTGEQLNQAKTVAETLNVQQTLLLLKSDAAVKELAAETARSGIRPEDPAWIKILQGVANKLRSTFGQSNPYKPKQ